MKQPDLDWWPGETHPKATLLQALGESQTDRLTAAMAAMVILTHDQVEKVVTCANRAQKIAWGIAGGVGGIFAIVVGEWLKRRLLGG
jgi:glucose-6-phosphate dehydrogenase assembly protein OpcA